MKYNYENCSVECSDTELCTLTCRPQDLSSPLFLSSALDSADGQMYYRIQSEAGAFYNPNVELSSVTSVGGVYFTLLARADGIIRKGGRLTVDKIKVIKGKGFMSPPDNLTVSLLKLSCYLLCIRDNLQTVLGRITYYNSESKKIRYINYDYTRAELTAFYNSLVEKVKYRIAATAKDAEGKDALASARFPYGELREGQEIMIREAHSAIKKGRRLFVEAPTGTGKTISSLFPAIRGLGEGLCDRIFYLTPKTATRREAFLAMSKLYSSGVAVRTVIITAREQICPFRANRSSAEGCKPELCEYAVGYYDRIHAALSELIGNYVGYSRSIIEQVALKHRVCPYELSLDLSELCSVIICDYNYVIDPIVYFRRYFGASGERGRYAFLVDEAHNLADRAREAYSAQISKSDFEKIRYAVDVLDKSNIRDFFNDVILAFSGVKRLCKETLIKDEKGEDRGFYISNRSYERICSAFESFVKSAQVFLKANPEHYLKEEISELLFSVRKYIKINEFFDENFRFYATVLDGDISVKCYCLDPSDLLDSLFLRASSTVYFSATLTPLEYFCDVLGGRNAKRVSLPSPFDPDRLCVAVADYVNTRFDDREQNASAFAKVIAATVSAKAGNYIAYFPSYKCLEDTYKAFVKKYPKVTTVVQKRNMTIKQKDEFLSSFKDDNGRLRIGFCVLGGVFSEGVDLPGSRLIGSIIFGVGLPGLSNEKNIIREHYDMKNDEGQGHDYAYAYPGMNNVLQAAGRVIRQEADTGIVVLADDRYATPKYRAMFPEHWKGVQYAGNASSLAEIMRRFWEKGQ